MCLSCRVSASSPYINAGMNNDWMVFSFSRPGVRSVLPDRVSPKVSSLSSILCIEFELWSGRLRFPGTPDGCRHYTNYLRTNKPWTSRSVFEFHLSVILGVASFSCVGGPLVTAQEATQEGLLELILSSVEGSFLDGS